PIYLHDSHHIELFKAGIISRAYQLKMRNGMRYTTATLFARRLNSIQRYTHSPITQGVDMHQPATLINSINQLRHFALLQQQLALLARVFIAAQQGCALSRILQHPISKHLDTRQTQVRDVRKALSDTIKLLQIRSITLRTGHQQGSNMSS